MRRTIIVALQIVLTGFIANAQHDFVYAYANARNEHEQFILDIENSMPQANASEVPVKTISLSTGIKLEYTEQGNENGTPVILLHGFPDSYRSYDLVLPHLPSSFHVFTLSLRGHGNSGKPQSGYNPADFAADVAAFMDAKKIKQAVIVGHSMGSAITQRFIINYSEKTKAAVLLGTFAKLYDKPEMIEFNKVIGTLKDPIDAGFIKDFQVSTFFKPIPATFLETLLQESAKVPAHVWKNVFSSLIKMDNVNELAQVKKPVLLMWGNKDVIGTEKDQKVLLAAIPGSKLITYTDIGHDILWEAPERFANDLITFINSIK